jgi:hypothetical protein
MYQLIRTRIYYVKGKLQAKKQTHYLTSVIKAKKKAHYFYSWNDAPFFMITSKEKNLGMPIFVIVGNSNESEVFIVVITDIAC